MSNFVTSEPALPCVVCKVPTKDVEVNFEAPVHPGECEDSLWEEYNEALISGADDPADEALEVF